jgi:zinc transport system permease protein
MDEITLRALLASVILAGTLGPLGSLVVWRRMAYFGDTIAHAALLGIALSLITGFLPMTLSMFIVAIGVALMLSRASRDGRFHSDTLLGLLAHGTLALGVLLVAMSRSIRVDVNSYLFGDVLALDWYDVRFLAVLCIMVLAVLYVSWRALLMVAIDRTIAHVEGVDVKRTEKLLILLLAAVIAIAIKLVGVLLITALLIIPAASARYFAKSPKQMALFASLIGIFAVSSGLFASIAMDAPTGPLMVVIATLCFLFCGAVAGLRKN